MHSMTQAGSNDTTDTLIDQASGCTRTPRRTQFTLEFTLKRRSPADKQKDQLAKVNCASASEVIEIGRSCVVRSHGSCESGAFPFAARLRIFLARRLSISAAAISSIVRTASGNFPK